MSELLRIENLLVSVKGKEILKGVDLAVNSGEILGVLGESGAGKSTLLRAIPRLLPVEFHLSGEVRLLGEDLVGLTEEELRSRRGRRVAMIFQEPLRYLNPSRTAGAQIERLVRLYYPGLQAPQIADRCRRIFREVGLPGVDRVLRSYPHQLSGGMRQRLMIAMALTGNPSLLLADEPTSALDVPLRLDIISLLRRLAAERSMGVVCVSHDLRALEAVADRLLVLFDGIKLEEGRVDQLLSNPRSSYTRRLLRSAPGIESRGASLLERGEGR
ncbi:MAG: ABC transporter ATP-binding protein [Alkalispirochaetaceae bacterium]